MFLARRMGKFRAALLMAPLSLVCLTALPCTSCQAQPPQLPQLPGRYANTTRYSPMLHDMRLTGQQLVPVVIGADGGNREADTFVLDTGASRDLVFDNVAARLQLPAFPGRPGLLNGTPVPRVMASTAVAGLGLSGPITVLPRALLSPLVGPDAAGVIGVDYLREFAVAFDFQAHTITLVHRGNLTDAERAVLGFAAAPAVPIRPTAAPFPEGCYEADVRVGARGLSLTEPLMIDTGSDQTVVSNALARGLRLGSSGPDVTSYSFAPGSYRAHVSRATLGLGAVSLPDQEVSSPADPKTPMPSVLGLDVLSQFRVLLDFPAGKMYLAPTVPAAPPVPVKSVAPVPAVAVPAAKP